VAVIGPFQRRELKEADLGLRNGSEVITVLLWYRRRSRDPRRAAFAEVEGAQLLLNALDQIEFDKPESMR
jgi:hypothetical protein